MDGLDSLGCGLLFHTHPVSHRNGHLGNKVTHDRTKRFPSDLYYKGRSFLYRDTGERVYQSLVDRFDGFDRLDRIGHLLALHGDHCALGMRTSRDLRVLLPRYAFFANGWKKILSAVPVPCLRRPRRGQDQSIELQIQYDSNRTGNRFA